MFDDLLQLGHKLTTTKYVLSEIKDPNTCTNVKRLMREHKLECLEKNSLEEIENFKRIYKKLEKGEIDVLLTYIKLSQHITRIYCILDDGNARKVASKLDLQYTGLIGLLRLLNNRGIKSLDEINKILKLLKEGGFRMPKHIDI